MGVGTILATRYTTAIGKARHLMRRIPVKFAGAELPGVVGEIDFRLTHRNNGTGRRLSVC